MREATISATPGTEFEEFFEAEYDRVVRAVFLASGQRDLAEEIAQEAMVRAYERWDRIRTMESPIGYVMKIAFNRQRSWLRAATRLLRLPASHEMVGGDTSDETSQRVMELLHSIPVTQRQALILVEWLGLTSEEAGKVLGIEATSVRGRIHRARDSFRHLLGDDDDA
jgi:RNA polymerase sigma factor (sigma-70 family)